MQESLLGEVAAKQEFVTGKVCQCIGHMRRPRRLSGKLAVLGAGVKKQQKQVYHNICSEISVSHFPSINLFNHQLGYFVEMLVLCLLVQLGLAMAATDPRDFSLLCGSGAECPAGWKKVDAGCILFAGWEEVRARGWLPRGHDFM